MSDLFSFLNSSKSFGEFFDNLKDIGVKNETLYVAQKYKGRPIVIDHELVYKSSIISSKTIVVSDSEGVLRDLTSYINNFPPTKDWKLSTGAHRSTISDGMYKLKQIMKFTGIEGVEPKIKDIVKEFRGTKKAYDFIVSHSDEIVLGYFPWYDGREAEGYAQLINAGANFPVTVERAKAAQRAVLDWLEKDLQKS